jgi:hypothetical protein
MKKKAYFIFLFGILLITNASYSQDKRFIEITCSDTVLLKPTSFVYQISLGEQMEFMGIKIPQKSGEAADAPPIFEIENLLKKGQFSYTVSDDNNYSISATKSSPVIYVQLKNETELKKLYETLKDKQGITGKVKEAAHEPVSMQYDKIYKKLYASAMAQA